MGWWKPCDAAVCRVASPWRAIWRRRYRCAAEKAKDGDGETNARGYRDQAICFPCAPLWGGRGRRAGTGASHDTRPRRRRWFLPGLGNHSPNLSPLDTRARPAVCRCSFKKTKLAAGAVTSPLTCRRHLPAARRHAGRWSVTLTDSCTLHVKVQKMSSSSYSFSFSFFFRVRFRRCLTVPITILYHA